MIPDEVREAALAARTGAAPLEHMSSEAIAGEISTAVRSPLPIAGADLRRLVAVLGRNDEMGTVDVLLVSNEIENATDLDLIVEAGDAGLPFTAMIQAELYGPLFIEQLQGRVGSISDGERNAVATALVTDGASLDEQMTGLPLGDYSDPRRAFKKSELYDLEELVAQCRRFLAEEPADVKVLDPELLLPPPSGTSLDDAAERFLEVLDVLVEMENRSVTIDAALLALLDEASFIDEISRWRTDFGFDPSRVLASIRVIEDEVEVVFSVGVEPTSTGRRTDDAVNTYLEGQAERGCPVVDIHTMQRCWSDQPGVRFVVAGSGNACRGRARVLEAA